MARDRASIGFEDALSGFDPGEWQPPKETRPKPPQDHTRAIAEATGFRSREDRIAPETPTLAPAGQGGPSAPAAPKPRRRRTGRNAQFNLKARPDTIDRFCAVADGQDWGLGETLEYAVALLEERYGGKG